MKLSKQKQHQLLHVAFPEAYEAAVTGRSLWVTLWDGKHRVKRFGRVESQPRIIEWDGRVDIRLTDAVGRGTGVRITQPRIGIAAEKAADPFYFNDKIDRPIYSNRRDTITLEDLRFEASIS